MTDPDPSLSQHTDYGSERFDEQDLEDDPVVQFARWLTEARDHGVYEPNAMVVGTVDAEGILSSRSVLLRGVDERGFTFFTNRSSRKGRAIAERPVATLLFPWYALHRQVIVTGDVSWVSDEESDTYWAGRPRGAQLAGTVSRQSEPIASRDELERRVRELESESPEGAIVPRPESWGGYRVAPWRIEFWQGRTSRLHDRLVFTRNRSSRGEWTLERLQP